MIASEPGSEPGIPAPAGDLTDGARPAIAGGAVPAVMAGMPTGAFPRGWAVDPWGRPIPAAWAALQWRQAGSRFRFLISAAVAAVPAGDRDLACRSLTGLLTGADARWGRVGGSDMFGRRGWPHDDEPPRLLAEISPDDVFLEDLVWGALGDAAADGEADLVRERLAELDRTCPPFRAALLGVVELMHLYAEPRIWVTPGDDRATYRSVRDYFALAPVPWMADDDGRLCLFRAGKPEPVTADVLIAHLEDARAVRTLSGGITVLDRLLGSYLIREQAVLLPPTVARLIAATRDWPALPRLGDVVSGATGDLISAWRAAYGTDLVTSAQIASLGIPGIPADRALIGRLLRTLADRGIVIPCTRCKDGNRWRLPGSEQVH